MIRVTRAQLKFLRRGRTLTIPTTTGQYHKGRTYAIAIPGQRHAVCRGQIIDLTDTSIRIRIAQDEPVRLLARNPIAQKADYVDQLGRAMWGEPEAVDQHTQDRLTELGTVRWAQLYAYRANQATLLSLRARVARLERAHAWGHTDFTSELRLLRQQLREHQDRI